MADAVRSQDVCGSDTNKAVYPYVGVVDITPCVGAVDASDGEALTSKASIFEGVKD